MVGCRNIKRNHHGRHHSVSGIPMVGCRNSINASPLALASVSGILSVGCRNSWVVKYWVGGGGVQLLTELQGGFAANASVRARWRAFRAGALRRTAKGTEFFNVPLMQAGG
jgi:hypothetical protein